jgi:hypothetical protein
VVGNGGDEDTGNDRQRTAEPGGEDKCEQLGFVADFCEGDDAGRDEEGFHVCA